MKQETEWVLKKPLIVGKKDKRYRKYVNQLKTRGFSDDETWNIDSTLSAFILPRLKRFKVINNGFPHGLSESKWNKILDQIIFAFEWNRQQFDEGRCKVTKSQLAANARKQEIGLLLFAKHFHDLWW